MKMSCKKSLSRALLIGSVTGLAALSAAAPASAQHGRWDDGRHYGGGYHHGGSARDAVRQCTFAAERTAARYGRADVTRIYDVDRHSRGYTVRGRIEVEQRRWGDHRWGRDDRHSDSGRFECRVRYGRVVHLDIDGIRGL